MTPPNTVTLETYRKAYAFPGVAITLLRAGVRARLPQEVSRFRTNLPTQPIYSSAHVEISYVLLIFIFAVLIVISLRLLRNLGRFASATAGLCPTCGYSLTGNTSGVCPECGTAFSARNPGG